MEGITYEQVDTLPDETLREILGDAAEGKNAAQMRAIVKGALRADEETLPEEPLPEPTMGSVDVMQESGEGKKEQNDDVITLSRSDFEALRKDIDEIRRENRELKSAVSSKTKLSRRAKQEAAHERCRVSDHFRDIVKEQRHFHATGEHKMFIVERSFQVEKEAFQNGRYIPCAPNGGMYYVRNKDWKPSPRTGEVRQPIVFNRHLYVDYTANGNEHNLLREDYALCDWKGNDVKPFQMSLPTEDLAEIRERNRLAEEARIRQTGIVDALKRLSQ